MDKKILSRPAYSLNNKQLTDALDAYMANPKDVEKLKTLIGLFRRAQVIVPVSFPKTADKRIVMKLLRGEPIRKGEEIPLFPLLVTDKEGNKFAPVFTSREKVVTAKDFPYMLRLPAAKVIENVMTNKEKLAGVIIDPQTKGFIFKRQAFETDFSKQPQKQVKTLSKDQFGVLARNSVEKGELPKRVFEKKAAFIEELSARGESLLLELYQKPYGDKVPSPYTEESFSVLVLDIDDETTAVCMELPKKGLVAGMARSAYIVRNPRTDDVYYYLIEKGQKGESDVLCSISPKDGHQELMTAPPIGSELTAVLELIREEEEAE